MTAEKMIWIVENGTNDDLIKARPEILAALRASAVGAGAREAHTPMPWRVDDTRIISTAEGIADDLVCVWDGADTPNWKADAAFIVEACNSHGIQFGAGEEDIVWRKINDEPFEYAIQQNPLYGDAFVRLLNGKCLRRKTNDK